MRREPPADGGFHVQTTDGFLAHQRTVSLGQKRPSADVCSKLGEFRGRILTPRIRASMVISAP